ncbi:MAG: sigma-54-dependent Fis family transcriptional regulator [Desulfobacterales bacterium]|nr:sigma-54-dependent Fis family transcriptional regulator [Desulfobacterales bacterium]
MAEANKTSKKKLLIIDDEENMRHMLTALLSKAGFSVESASDGLIGLKKLEENDYNFVLCDIKMPNLDGIGFLKRAKACLPNTTIIMMSAYGTIESAVEAVKLGAYDYISKPFKSDEIILTLRKAEEREILKKENMLLKEHIKKIEKDYSFGTMTAKSKSMLSVFELATKVAQYDTTVLITGESGTGKELIARGIHYAGKRKEKPLIPVNCGSIPENLLESELFGYKKGAFTGADRNKKGLFEEANDGTIFLDEIGELPLNLQVKLLRVIQESEIRPIGDSKSMKIDVRVLAATAKNLEEEVLKGTFREDLFYRLNVLRIKLPSLKERKEDIALLSQYFIEKFNKKFGKHIKGISPQPMLIFLKYHWPGNVRELENAIERAVLLSEDDFIASESLPPEMCDDALPNDTKDVYEGFSIKASQKILEKTMIIKALKKTGGNRTHASNLLEISHPSLLAKMKLYGIE